MRTLHYLIIGSCCFVLGALFAWQIERKRSEMLIRQADTIVVRDPLPLTDWQMLEMAIIETESKFNPKAEGECGARGIFQITPIFVAEANRILGDEEFTIADSYDASRSLQMFRIVQNKHNPSGSVPDALRIHNPGGKHTGYNDRVIKAYNQIVNYERIREIVRK